MAGGFTTVVDLGLEPIPGWNPCIFLPPCFWFVLTGGHNGTCIRMDSIGGCLELDATALRWLLQFSFIAQRFERSTVVLIPLFSIAPTGKTSSVGSEATNCQRNAPHHQGHQPSCLNGLFLTSKISHQPFQSPPFSLVKMVKSPFQGPWRPHTVGESRFSCAFYSGMVDPPFLDPLTNPSSNLPGLDTFWNRFETLSSNLSF